ncbi:MFS transporter [Luteolibacter marinus]|uniref:MFS transporter n=1 Tax=Luteolibacter marinus TaxID=2776705 RepID=UPI0018688FED|nr:MFS transporter [Luteolibacter marinus]
MKLSIREKAGYGLGDTASNFVWALMMNFIMFYYTDIFGITAAAAGTMLLFAHSTDGVADFLIGAMADRTRSRWGRFRPYLVWMCLPLGIAFVLTFTTPDWSDNSKLVYAWVTYNLLMLSYSAINIPYGALSGVMTDDPIERTSLNSYRMAFAQAGGIIANTSFLWLVKVFGKGDQAEGARWTVFLFSGIAVVLFLVSFLATRERIHPPATQKTRLREDIGTLFANRHWLVMFVAGITGITFAVIRGSGIIYYLKSYLLWGEERIAAFFLVSGLAMIAGAMATRFFVARLGKKNAFIASMVVVALSSAPFYWITPGQPVLVFGFQVIGMVMSGVNAALFWALVADTADFAEWKFSVRTTGIIFSATTCAQKVGMGLGAAFAGKMLSDFGYEANVAQTERSIHGILLLVSLVPAAGCMLVAALFSVYGLNEAACATIRDDLAARRLARGE